MKDIGATQKQFELKENMVFQFNNGSLIMDIEYIIHSESYPKSKAAVL
jgi:hypothetical protein